MPRGQPFTKLCQRAARLAWPSRADLHAHTTASDGDTTPAELIRLAHSAGLAAIAITDHDTTAGVVEAISAAASLPRHSPLVVPGVEISVRHQDREYHLLGLFIDPESELLQRGLAAIRAARRERFLQMVATLKQHGAELRTEILDPLLVGDRPLGRRHLAAALVAGGHARSLHDAFRRWILPVPATVPHAADFSAAIGWIRASGGVASLAHPNESLGPSELQHLSDLGLDAIEANFPAVTATRAESLHGIAGKLDLAVTAGSDYHAAPQVLGSRTIPVECLDDLRGRKRSASLA